MNQKQITDRLFRILKEQDALFSNVTQDETSGTLVVQTITGDRFTIAVTAASPKGGEEIAKLELYSHFFTIQMEILLMQMKAQGILSDDEYRNIWSRVSDYADSEAHHAENV